MLNDGIIPEFLQTLVKLPEGLDEVPSPEFPEPFKKTHCKCVTVGT